MCILKICFIMLHKPSILAAVAAKSRQSCPTLSDPMDCSLPGSSTHGIFQARVLEWAATAFSALYPYYLFFMHMICLILDMMALLACFYMSCLTAHIAFAS